MTRVKRMQTLTIFSGVRWKSLQRICC